MDRDVVGSEDGKIVCGDPGKFRLRFVIVHLSEAFTECQGVDAETSGEVGAATAFGKQGGFVPRGGFARGLLQRQAGRIDDALPGGQTGEFFEGFAVAFYLGGEFLGRNIVKGAGEHSPRQESTGAVRSDKSLEFMC